MRTCGTCIHRAPGKFHMHETPGVDQHTVFFGCEYHEPFVGMQPATKACKWYEPEATCQSNTHSVHCSCSPVEPVGTDDSGPRR